jgi:hypothetical protein
VVLEAGWNWESMYDWLLRVENVVEVQLAHPYGVRAIASAQVKPPVFMQPDPSPQRR